MKALAILALLAAAIWLDNDEPQTVNLTAADCVSGGCYGR